MEELEPVGFGIATVHTEHEKEVDILIGLSNCFLEMCFHFSLKFLVENIHFIIVMFFSSLHEKSLSRSCLISFSC